MATQDELVSFYWARLVFGVMFALGLVAYFISFFISKYPEPIEAKVA